MAGVPPIDLSQITGGEDPWLPSESLSYTGDAGIMMRSVIGP